MRLEAGRWRSLRAPPDSIAAIGGGVLLLRGREEKGEGREGEATRKGRGGKGRGLPPLYLTSGFGPVHVGGVVCRRLSAFRP